MILLVSPLVKASKNQLKISKGEPSRFILMFSRGVANNSPDLCGEYFLCSNLFIEIVNKLALVNFLDFPKSLQTLG